MAFPTSQSEELSNSYIFCEMNFSPDGLSKAPQQGQGCVLLQRLWAEVRAARVFLLPSAVISSVHLIIGHNLTLS
jgi:hypothetical protein